MRIYIKGIIKYLSDNEIEIEHDNVCEKFTFVSNQDSITKFEVGIHNVVYVYDFWTQFDQHSFAFDKKISRTFFEMLMKIKNVGIVVSQDIIKNFEMTEFVEIIRNHDFDKLITLRTINITIAKQIIKSLNICLFSKTTSTKEQQIIDSLQKLGFNIQILYKILESMDVSKPIDQLIEMVLKEAGEYENKRN